LRYASLAKTAWLQGEKLYEARHWQFLTKFSIHLEFLNETNKQKRDFLSEKFPQNVHFLLRKTGKLAQMVSEVL
jgi:hypothetical protein